MNIPYLSLKRVTAMHLEEIKDAVDKVVESGWYLGGEAVKHFEADYAQYIGTMYCIGCGNGLDALTLIFRAYKEMGVLQEGDEIIVPANAFIASILSITENGLKPVLVEPWVSNLEINETLIEDAITEKTRAILLVHMYGRNAWTPGIQEICDRWHLKLIEDNAQAVGSLSLKFKISFPLASQEQSPASQNSKLTGAIGDAAAHSFYPGKNLGAMGDAGAVTTNDKQLAYVVRALGNYGSNQKYVFQYKGKNSRMDEIQAAALDVKLKYVDEDNARRRAIADYYYNHIENPDILMMSGKTEWEMSGGNDLECNYHIFPILCAHRDAMQAHLKDKGVGTIIHYPIPPHKQQCFKKWSAMSLPATETIHLHELSLPCNQTMTDEEAAYVCDAVNSFRA